MSFNKAKEAVFRATQAAFGTSVTYTHIEDSSVETIRGVFKNNPYEVQGVHTSTLVMKPTVRVWLADLTLPPTEGDTLLIDGIEYRLADFDPDSFGGATLILEKN